MSKYYAIQCDDVSTLQEAVKKKEIIIELSPSIQEQLKNDINDQMEEKKVVIAKPINKCSKAVAVIGALSLACALISPAGWAFAGGAAIAELLTMTGGAAIVVGISELLKNTDYTDYEIATFGYGGRNHILLISKDFNRKADLIEGYEEFNFISLKDCVCPQCNKKVSNIKKMIKEKKNPCTCNHCTCSYIWTIKAEKEK